MRVSPRSAVLLGILAAGMLALGTSSAQAHGPYGPRPGPYRYRPGRPVNRPYWYGRPAPLVANPYYGPLRPAVRIYPYAPVPYGVTGLGGVYVPNGWGFPVAPAPIVSPYWW